MKPKIKKKLKLSTSAVERASQAYAVDYAA